MRTFVESPRTFSFDGVDQALQWAAIGTRFAALHPHLGNTRINHSFEDDEAVE